MIYFLPLSAAEGPSWLRSTVDMGTWEGWFCMCPLGVSDCVTNPSAWVVAAVADGTEGWKGYQLHVLAIRAVVIRWAFGPKKLGQKKMAVLPAIRGAKPRNLEKKAL